ncbi:PIN domain-containing protein [Streptomyces sp. NPDC059629]|uniref:PIN domain-containing protein n=1 Tax=Streptomyces sp. NPDC059629 TaxID=3346889 RepID=UPI0036BD4E91
MIILDSNILKGISLRGPEAELLRTIRTSGVERVAAPWIVLEELAAQQALAYAEKHAAALAAVTKLDKATPWGQVTPPEKADSEQVREHWRARYAELAETLKTSPAAYEQAMFREANLLAPCKTVNSGKHKTGARDAAIWLTSVEYAREHPEETVCFVSNNTEDFGDGTSFKYPLDEDLEGLGQRFVLFTSLDGVIAKFATEIEAPEEDVRSALAKPSASFAIVHAARHNSDNLSFVATVVDRKTRQLVEVPVAGRFAPPSVALDSVRDIRAYEIAGHKWCTATARWLLSGFVSQPYSHSPAPVVDWAWETRVLLSTTAPMQAVTVLRSGAFTPVSPEDIDHLPPLLISGAIEDLRMELVNLQRAAPDLSGMGGALARALGGLNLPDLTAHERVLVELHASRALMDQDLFGEDLLHRDDGTDPEDSPEQESD